MKIKISNRLLSMALAVLMALTLLPVTARAAPVDNVPYLDAGGNSQTKNGVNEITLGALVTFDNLTAGWYIVYGIQAFTSANVTVTDDVHLILADGCDLKVTGDNNKAGIQVEGSNSLTVYAQSTDPSTMGKLTAQGGGGSTGGAGIGGGGTITINGGTVKATGGGGAANGSGAGIGGNGGGGGGTITINGGAVTAKGGNGLSGDGGGAGIGGGGGSTGGTGGTGGTIIINGGTVTAIGGMASSSGNGGAGIGGGGGGTGGGGGSITINNGIVTATGGSANGTGVGGASIGSGGTSGSPGAQDTNYHIITASAGAGGAIAPSGNIVVANTGGMSFTITADPNYAITEVLVDSNPVAITDNQSMSYSFTNVTANQTIAVTFTNTLITANPTSLAFGNVTVNTASDKTLDVTGANLTGNITYALTGDTGAFAIAETTWTAATGGTLTVTFSPTAVQSYSATLTLQSTGAPDVTVALTGLGTAVPAPPPPPTPSSGGDYSYNNYTPPTPSSSFTGGNSYTNGSGVNLVHVTQKGFSLFGSVRMDGKTLTRNTDYKAESGSTVITVYADYLDTLAVGKHKLSVVFTDGVTVTAEFTVEAAPTPQPWVNPFEDVTETAWYYGDVEYVYTNGLMSGTSADPMLFSPNIPLTRGMVVTILYRQEGEPDVSAERSSGTYFTDVDPSAWYATAVAWAAENGIANGSGDLIFKPEDNITRQDLAAILWRYAQYAGLDVSAGMDTNILSYNDAFDIAEYAIPAMQWVCGAGVIGGKPGGLIDPRSTATRAEAAAMLHRLLGAVLSE